MDSGVVKCKLIKYCWSRKVAIKSDDWTLSPPAPQLYLSCCPAARLPVSQPARPLPTGRGSGRVAGLLDSLVMEGSGAAARRPWQIAQSGHNYPVIELGWRAVSAYRSADRGPWVAPRRAGPIPTCESFPSDRFTVACGGNTNSAAVWWVAVDKTGTRWVARPVRNRSPTHAFACFGCRCQSDQGRVAHIVKSYASQTLSFFTFIHRKIIHFLFEEIAISNVVPATPKRC